VIELFYITEITPYDVPDATMRLFYDFHLDDLWTSWSAVILFLVLFRVAPLMILFVKEGR